MRSESRSWRFMMVLRRNLVAETYSAGAGVYERLWASALRPINEKLVASLPLHSATTVLDAGTGVGTLLPVLRDATPAAFVLGVDASSGMLGRAPAGFPLAAMDLNRLALADRTFDVAVAAFVLFHLDDPLLALRELARVLRPGGMLGMTSWEGDPNFAAQRVWIEELDRVGAPPVPPLLHNEPLSTPERVAALLDAAGLEMVRSEYRPLDFVHRPDTFLELRTSVGSSYGRFVLLPAERRAEMVVRMRARLAELPPEAFVDRTRALLTWARR